MCLPHTSRRRFAKRKSKAKALLQYNFPFPFSRTKSMQSIVWNPLQDGMESSRRKYTSGDAMRLRRYHTRLRVIPYQACGLNKKIDKSKLVDFFGRGIGIRTPTYRVRVCCAAVTQFPYAFNGLYSITQI